MVCLETQNAIPFSCNKASTAARYPTTDPSHLLLTSRTLHRQHPTGYLRSLPKSVPREPYRGYAFVAKVVGTQKRVSLRWTWAQSAKNDKFIHGELSSLDREVEIAARNKRNHFHILHVHCQAHRRTPVVTPGEVNRFELRQICPREIRQRQAWLDYIAGSFNPFGTVDRKMEICTGRLFGQKWLLSYRLSPNDSPSAFFRPVRVGRGFEGAFAFHRYDGVFDPPVFSNSLRQSCNDKGGADGACAAGMLLPTVCIRRQSYTLPLDAPGVPRAEAATLEYPIQVVTS